MASPPLKQSNAAFFLFLAGLSALVTFGVGQVTPGLSGAIVGLVAVPLLLGLVLLKSSNGDTKGCAVAIAIIFGTLTVGCLIGAGASLLLDNWKS